MQEKPIKYYRLQIYYNLDITTFFFSDLLYFSH